MLIRHAADDDIYYDITSPRRLMLRLTPLRRRCRFRRFRHAYEGCRRCRYVMPLATLRLAYAYFYSRLMAPLCLRRRHMRTPLRLLPCFELMSMLISH